MNQHIAPVPLAKACRLINHGPTVLVSGHHAGVDDVMAVAWACAVDFTPSKLMVVLDKSSKTRELIEKSGFFVVQVPTVTQAQLTYDLGKYSLYTEPDKLAKCAVELFHMPDVAVPLVAGCSAWLLCEVIPEPHNQQAHDMFIGNVVAAWADDRIFTKDRWHFETGDPNLRSLHYIAGGHFYTLGEAIEVNTQGDD